MLTPSGWERRRFSRGTESQDSVKGMELDVRRTRTSPPTHSGHHRILQDHRIPHIIPHNHPHLTHSTLNLSQVDLLRPQRLLDV